MHNIEKNDKQQGVSQAWHGLTEVKEVITFQDNWLRSWDVTPVEMARNGVATGWSQFECTDNPAIIPGRGLPFRLASTIEPDDEGDLQDERIGQGTYSPITNAQFLDIAERSLEEIDYQILSVGSVRNRGRIFISMKIKGLEKFSAAGRDFEPYLNFGSSHDQSSVYYGNTSNICTVCDNTFTMNLLHNGKNLNCKVRHTKNAPDKLANIPLVIGGAIEAQTLFLTRMNEFALVSLTDTDATELFTGFVVGKGKEEISTRASNIVDRLVQLFHAKSAGNAGANLADAFSAVTDYYSHESAGENVEKQMISSEFGSGHVAKARAFELFSDADKVNELKAIGRSLV